MLRTTVLVCSCRH
ncbi:TPA: hypothetical protein N0F65_004672 [Lagenidium giganteum]|uniref:Uncharacterized protein n=1 Tax=Lagenidium giganteum TaxID=4803 RepID=A0AAV2Z4U3_9STRA|nr:TPA: hypothetical protein N0F65_004672 [Lagenidium giganteum]